MTARKWFQILILHPKILLFKIEETPFLGWSFGKVLATLFLSPNVGEGAGSLELLHDIVDNSWDLSSHVATYGYL